MAARKIGSNTGNMGKGRPKGAKNKTTVAAKEAIALAAEGIGGTQRMIDWIKADEANEKIFWSQMYTKLLPHQVEGTGEAGEIIFKTVYESK